MVAKICRNQKDWQGIFLPFRSLHVFCVLFLHLQRTHRQLKAQHEIITGVFVLEGQVFVLWCKFRKAFT